MSMQDGFTRSRSPAIFLLYLALAACVVVPGCSGCPKWNPVNWRKQKQEEAKKQKEDKPKEDFEYSGTRILPSDEETFVRNEVKPGHWLTTVRAMKANNFDFRGVLRAASVERGGEPFDVPNTPFRFYLARPAPLPKGQAKYFETIHFVPHLEEADPSKVVWFQTTLLSATGGREVASSMIPTVRMPAYQTFFVVLASEPESYGYLQTLDSVMPPSAELFSEDRMLYYRVVLAKANSRIPLPSQPLTWTTISHILWDGIVPQSLTPDQQTALVDWLHWGGQLIVSGPNSLDAMRGTFLDPYMPVVQSNTVELLPEDLRELDRNWSIPSNRNAQRLSLNLEGGPLVGVRMEKHPEANYLSGTGELVIERRVGGGRIVVTAFPLSDRQIVNWGSFDNFVNACLLRRPARKFAGTELHLVKTEWADRNGSTKDPRLVSPLRYFTRDVEVAYQSSPPDGPARLGMELPAATTEQPAVAFSPVASDWNYATATHSHEGGVAAWSDTNGTAVAARGALREAAGISIPRSGFVIRVLAVYLLVLVPVNWGIFRLLGRVEWAWVAAPLIALIGAVGVVRLAQLDIGFARSRSQINVVEVQGSYPRAHLTRYIALYTSLSTAYDLQFDERSAIALPFAANPSYQRGLHDQVKRVTFVRNRDQTLQGFQIDSNSTGMVHSEQMIDLGGGFELSGSDEQPWVLKNGTSLAIEGAAVVRRSPSGQLQAAWIGGLAPESQQSLQFEPLSPVRAWLPQWEESAITARSRSSDADALGLWRLIEVATSKLPIAPGEVRLIGWNDDDLPGMTISPQASQTHVRSLIIAHLRRGPLPDPRPDANASIDVQVDLEEEKEPPDDVMESFRDR